MSNIVDIFNANNIQYNEIITIMEEKAKPRNKKSFRGLKLKQETVLLDKYHFPGFAEITCGYAVVVNTAG